MRGLNKKGGKDLNAEVFVHFFLLFLGENFSKPKRPGDFFREPPQIGSVRLGLVQLVGELQTN